MRRGPPPALVTSQRWVYEYSGVLGSGARIAKVSLERPPLPQHLRVPYEVVLRHWSAPELGGTEGDLMQVDVTTDLSPTARDVEPQTVTKTWYYRYYTAEWSDEEQARRGWPHQTRYFLGPDAIAELDASSYREADVSGVADRVYEYCEDHRTSALKLRGISCGGCGGQGSYSYGWALEKPQSVAVPNESHIKVHIRLPHEASVDSLRRILIFNAYGEKLLDARCVRETAGSPELSWVDAAEYGTEGEEAWRLRRRFWPSAMAAFDPGAFPECAPGPAPPFEGDGDIQGYQASPASGRQREYVYDWSQDPEPVFTLTTNEGIAEEGGFRPMDAVSVKLLAEGDYRRRAVTWKLSEYDEDGGQVVVRDTTFSYTHRHTEDTLALKRWTKTYPAVSVSKNGPGYPVSEYFGESRLGMPQWQRNPAGRIEFRDYDAVTWELARIVEDADLSSLPGAEPPPGFYTPSGAIHAETTFALDGLGRVVRVESPGGLADDETELRRVERRVYARLGGPSGKLSADRPAVLVYPHVENDLAENQTATPKGEVSISVSTPGGRPHAVASAYLPPGTAPYFYLGHWEWGSTPAQTLHAIFQPRADCHLLERREYSYAYEGSEEHLVVKEDVWTSPESSSPNSYYQTTRENNGLGLPWKVLGPLTSGASGFRELRLTSYDALARAVSWSVGSEGGSDLVVVRRVAYDGGEPGGGLVVGDGHLTRSVAYRGEQASPDEETRYDFDWRGLTERVWEGYDASSGTAALVRVYARDYRGRVAEEAGRVGTEGGTLRSLSKTLYDERGRVYETQTYGVEEDGTV